VAETWLEARAGIEPAHGPFLLHVVDAIVYPDLPEWLVVGGAVFVCVAILCVYLRRYGRRTADGSHASRIEKHLSIESYRFTCFSDDLGWHPFQ
jgi:hypothetical protein